MSTAMDSPRTAWTLSLTGVVDGDADDTEPQMLFSALVILSDGRFAAVSVNDCVDVDGVQDLTDSRVGVHGNLAELRPQFLQDWGGRLRLTLPHLPHPANIGWRALSFSQVRRELQHLLREK